jgi:hypothetical protein
LSLRVVRLSPALPTAYARDSLPLSFTTQLLSPVWSRLARQPLRVFRDASFAIPLPISQTLTPAVTVFPCALPVVLPPSTQAALRRVTEANQLGWAALLPGGSMTRRACTNALRYGICIPTAQQGTVVHKIFLSRHKCLRADVGTRWAEAISGTCPAAPAAPRESASAAPGWAGIAVP